MSSQRLKCLDFLSSDINSAKRASDFLPYLHERDDHGNLLSINSQRRQFKKLIPIRKLHKGELTIRNLLQLTEQEDGVINCDTPEATHISNEIARNKFYVQNDWKYINEHSTNQARKRKLKKLGKILNSDSLQRIQKIPCSVDYNPNYEYNQKKTIHNVIIPKEKQQKYQQFNKSQFFEEESPTKKEQSTKNQNSQLNFDIKKNPYYPKMKEQFKYEQFIADISNFQKKIDETILKCHLSKDRIFKCQ